MSIYKHGINGREQSTSLTAPITGSAGLQVVFGTAPVHLAEDPAKAANTPIVCYSFADFTKALGYSDDFKRFTLCQSADMSFRVYSVAPVIFVNVLDPANEEHITENQEESVTASGGVAVYAKDCVLLSSIVVKSGEDTLKAGEDYTAEHSADGTSVTITLISEAHKGDTDLKISSKSLNPEAVTEKDIIGGYDAKTGRETGLELIRQVFPKLGLIPGQIIAPGWSHKPNVAVAIQAKTTGINGSFDCSAFIDIAANDDGAKVYTDCKQAKEKTGISSPNAFAVWPLVAVGSKVYYFSAAAAAHMAYNDAQDGDVPFDGHSNQSMPITATVLEDGTEVYLDQEQANDMLNANGIVTAINHDGFRLWGNNTSAYPSTTDPKDRWISVRRFFNWDGNNFIRTYFQKVDRPANKRLIQSIIDSQNVIGNGYVARDYCAGYRVEFREDENPATSLLDGHLTVHTFLAPYVPAEYIENVREYDIDALTGALGGE